MIDDKLKRELKKKVKSRNPNINYSMEHLEVTQIERLQRVEIVFALIVSGASHTEIAKYCEEKWKLKETALYDYIKDARKNILKQSEATMEENRTWHIAHRKYMLGKEMQKGNHSLALSIAQDMAKIQGLYVERHELLIGKKEDKELTNKARALLEGAEYKIIEPEGGSEYGS